MIRRPPLRPGVSKKGCTSSFKVTYSVNQLLAKGKASVSEESGCPPPEGWEKYQYDKIGPLHQEDGNPRQTPAATKEYLATLVMKPGSARDLHAEHLAALAAKQAQAPDLHSSLGTRGGGTRVAGLGRGERDRDRDRFGDRNKDRDWGLARFDHDRDRRGDGGRRERPRDGQQPSNRPPSRWDALKPDRDRDRGYNNRSNRDSRDRDDGDELGGGSRQDARLGGGRERDGRNARGGDSVRDGGLAAHDRALASERAGGGGSGGRERDRDRGAGGGGSRDRYGGGGMTNEADIWDMPASALPGTEGASKDPPRNSRAAGLRSAEREQREKDRKAEEVREFQATKLLFEKELERKRAGYKQQGQAKGDATTSNGDATATGFPDMGGGFLDGNDIDDNNGGLSGGALEESPSATPAGETGGEENGIIQRRDGGEPERDSKPGPRGFFLDGLLGGGSPGDSSRGDRGITTVEPESKGRGDFGGGGGNGGTRGGFPGGGLFSFMAPGNSISTIDKFTEVTRSGAGKIFSPDDGTTPSGAAPSRLSSWDKTANRTAKAAPPAGGGGEGSTAALSAAEKSNLLKRMIMGGGAGVPKGSGTPSPQQHPSNNRRPAADRRVEREGGSLWRNGGAPVEAARSQGMDSEGGVVGGETGGTGVAAVVQPRGASMAEVNMLMQKLAVARLPEDQRRKAFKQAQQQGERQQKHYQQQQRAGGGRSSPLLMPSQPPSASLGSPTPPVIDQPELPAGPPPSLSAMSSSSPPLGGMSYRSGGQMPLAGGGGGAAGGLMAPAGRLPGNNGQQQQQHLGIDFAVEEARRRQLQQQQRRQQQQLQLIQQQQQQQRERERERDRQVDQYRQLQMQQRLEQQRQEQQRQEQQRQEHQRLEHQRQEHQRLELQRLDQQRQQDLRHRQEQVQLEQQQAVLRQQRQRRYVAEASVVPLPSGSHMLQQQQQQQMLRQRQLQLQQQQHMHLRQPHPHPHPQHVPRGAAVSSVRAVQGLPVGGSLLQQQQQHRQRQLIGETSGDGSSHLLSPVGGPIVMPGQQPSGYPQGGHSVARQPQTQGGGGYPGGGHLQQRMGPQPQPPSSHSSPTMSHGGGSGSGTMMNSSVEFPSRTRADVDLLSVLGLQKAPADPGAGHAGYGGGGDLSGGGGGGGHQFAFHEPQPGARRARAVNGMGGSMALDPRARARALAGGMGVGPGVGVVGRKMTVRPGGTPRQMTAEDMERIVTGN